MSLLSVSQELDSGISGKTEKPGKMGRHFPVSPGILNRLEKSGKITQNTGKFRELNLVVFKCTVYHLLKWIKFSVKKTELEK